MMEPPARQRRRHASKTKTGCQTCKIRRVKCDESKPACQRCTSTGRTCDGYRLQLLLSSPDSYGSAAILRGVATQIPGTAQEKRGFHYFITHTAAELTGYYTSSFWERLVLQVSTAEPSLRHAVIAIGSLHEEFTTNPHRRLPHGLDKSGSAFAVHQYVKAISHLRRSLSTRKPAPLTALLSCILFVCFDFLRGGFDTAMLHLQSGLKILRGLRSSAEEKDTVERSIAPLFMRLGMQSILYVDTRNAFDQREFARQLLHVVPAERPMPSAFESLDEARAALDRAADGLFRMFYMCDADQPMHRQPPEALSIYATSRAHLLSWTSSFTAFISTSPPLTALQLRGAALLKIHHVAATIMARSVPDLHDPRSIAVAADDAEVFASCTDEFRMLVRLCRSLVADGKPARTFGVDLGVVAPLYYVCIKCTDVGVREEAVELLGRWPRREGMWDSGVGVRMVREFWEIRERHRGSGGGCGLGEVALGEAVDLVLEDEMRWEWKWRWKKKGVEMAGTEGMDEG